MGQCGGRGLARSEQITGREHDRLAALLRQRYEQGAAIRDLAARTGRSYGWVRTLLREAGVELRGRGGDHRERLSTAQDSLSPHGQGPGMANGPSPARATGLPRSREPRGTGPFPGSSGRHAELGPGRRAP